MPSRISDINVYLVSGRHAIFPMSVFDSYCVGVVFLVMYFQYLQSLQKQFLLELLVLELRNYFDLTVLEIRFLPS